MKKTKNGIKISITITIKNKPKINKLNMLFANLLDWSFPCESSDA